MSNILVTGGAGYLGTVLVPKLLRDGHDVTVLDNFYYNQPALLDCCIYSNFHIIRGDCRKEELLKKVLEDKEYIIPLAALVGYILCNQDEVGAESTNVDAIKTLLKLRKSGQKIIFPCTNSGYGVGERDKFCTEETPMNPITLYGRTKAEAERLVLSEENTVTFRFATVFGASPKMRLDLLVNDFVYRAVYDKTTVIFQGHFKRNYIHVQDATDAIIWGLNHFEQMKGRPYNCGLSSANLSKLELCAKIKEHIPGFIYLEAPVGEDPDQRDYIVSNERLEATGWKANYDLDMGIEELIKAFSIIKNSIYTNW